MALGLRAQGQNEPARWFRQLTCKYAHWGGQACNPYDTARVPRGTSNGSGVSVAANLATCSICEQSSASCKGPASRNNIVNLSDDQGHHDGRRHRQQEPGRSRRHPLQDRHGCRRWCSMRSRASSREDMFTAHPEGPDPEGAVRQLRGDRQRRQRQAAQGHAHRHRPRVHGQAHQERRGHQRSDRQGDQDRPARQARRGAGRDRSIRCTRTIRLFPT